MCPSLIEIGSKTAEKNSAQTTRQTDTTKIMVTWTWTNFQGLRFYRGSNFPFSYWFLNGPYNSAALMRCLW